MLDDLEVKRLLLRAAARDDGSADAFARLYKQCAPLILGVAQRIVSRRELAEEALYWVGWMQHSLYPKTIAHGCAKAQRWRYRSNPRAVHRPVGQPGR